MDRFWVGIAPRRFRAPGPDLDVDDVELHARGIQEPADVGTIARHHVSAQHGVVCATTASTTSLVRDRSSSAPAAYAASPVSAAASAAQPQLNLYH